MRDLTISLLLDRIRETYASMTPANQTLARYVLEHHHDLAFAPVSRVAKAVGVSPATVVRFAEYLDLSGYTELQAIARQALRDEVSTVSQLERASASQTSDALLADVLRTDIKNLEQALATVSGTLFSDVVDVLASARTIHLVGLRSTFGMVHHFASYLGWIGRSAKVLSPSIGDLPEQLMTVSDKDACVALSFRRYTKDTVEIFKATRDAGARTIAITDSELSLLTEHADLALAVPVQSPAFFESRTAVLSVLNALVFGIALRHRRHTVASLHKHEQAWSSHGTYSNENFAIQFNADIEAFETHSKGRQSSKAKQTPQRDRRTGRGGNGARSQ